MRRYPARIFLLILGSLAAVLVFEVALRHTRFGVLLPYDDGMPLDYYRNDPETGFDIVAAAPRSTHQLPEHPYAIWSNELGCFDLPFDGHRGPYTLLVGDSYTWGFTPFTDKWGALLERFLGERVLKCGVSGYGTKQALVKARRLLERLPRPRAIVLGYFVNDAGDDAGFPRYRVHRGRLVTVPGHLGSYDALDRALPDLARWAERYCMSSEPEHPTWQRVKCLLRRHSLAYVLAQEQIKRLVSLRALRAVGIVNRPRPEPELEDRRGPDRDVLFRRHLEHLAAFQALAGSVGARLIVVLVTPPRAIVSDEAGDPYGPVKAFLGARGIPFVDLWTTFRAMRTPLYWARDLHWNVAGNHLAGLLVARDVVQRDLLPVPDSDETLARIAAALAAEFGL